MNLTVNARLWSVKLSGTFRRLVLNRNHPSYLLFYDSILADLAGENPDSAKAKMDFIELWSFEGDIWEMYKDYQRTLAPF